MKKLKLNGNHLCFEISPDAPSATLIFRSVEDGELLRYYTVKAGRSEDGYQASVPLGSLAYEDVMVEVRPPSMQHILLDNMSCSDAPADTHRELEPNRQRFHFTPPTGWSNDPNAPFFYQGAYHLFYQRNPLGIEWGNMHWGHAISRDLLHFSDTPDALEPDSMGSMFSGSSIVDVQNASGLKVGDHDPILLFYTAAGDQSPEPKPFVQCMAFSTDGGMTFQKYSKNPILTTEGLAPRDPVVSYCPEMNSFVMALYLGDDSGIFALFESKNLITWNRFQEFTLEHGRECPALFTCMDEHDRTHWVFLEANGHYRIGHFNSRRLEFDTPSRRLFLRTGEFYCYAPQVWQNHPDHRSIGIAWQQGERAGRLVCGGMTLPFELKVRTFSDGYYLTASPVRELQEIYDKNFHYENVKPQHTALWQEVPAARTWKVDLELDPQSLVNLNVCGIDMALDGPRREVRVFAARLPFHQDTTVMTLHIVVDHASLEVFLGDGTLFIAKYAVTRNSPPVIFCHGHDNDVTISKVDIHLVKETI